MVSNKRHEGEKLNESEIKSAQLSILDRFTEIANINKLNFFLHYGSLLGGVRHGGYIPWDDDIDLAMLREDYDKLTQINWPQLGLQLYHPNHEKGHNYPFAKIVDHNYILLEGEGSCATENGLNIDIFPIDSCTKPEFKIKALLITPLSLALTLKSVGYSAQRSSIKNTTLQIGRIFLAFCTKRRIASTIDFIARSGTDLKKSRASLTGPYKNIEFYPKNYFSELSHVTFEGRLTPAPKEYHLVLETIYRDHMVPPSKEKQVSHHSFSVHKKPLNSR